MSFHYQAPLNRSGFGTVGRGLLRGFAELGLSPQLTPIYGVELDEPAGDSPSLVGRFAAERADPRADTVKLWHHHSDLTNWAGRGRRALYTFFEVDHLPSGQVDELNRQTDEAWVASHWAAGVLERSGYANLVRVLPAGVDPAVFHAGVAPAQVEGLGPSTFAFVTAGKWSLNKGHDVLLEAFNRAFRPSDDVALICACFNGVRGANFDGPKESAKWADWYEGSALGRAGKVRCFRTHLASQRELAAVFARADAGVFSYRAEGFCLELFEMTAMGKHCLATLASAPAEYLDEIGAVGIPPDGCEAAYDPPFFFGDANWAHLGPSCVKTLSEEMRGAFELGRQDNEKGLLWGAQHSWRAVAETAAGYLLGDPSSSRCPTWPVRNSASTSPVENVAKKDSSS